MRFPVNLEKFIRTPFLQTTSGDNVRQWNKSKLKKLIEITSSFLMLDIEINLPLLFLKPIYSFRLDWYL